MAGRRPVGGSDVVPKASGRPLRRAQIVGLVALWAGTCALLVWMFLGGPVYETRALLFLFLLVAAAGFSLVVTLRNRWLRSALEPPQIQLVNARPKLGETVNFNVRLQALRAVRVRRLVVVLSCVEEVRDARGRGKVLPVVVRRDEVEIATDLKTEPDEPLFLHGSVIVPSDGMQSFESHLCAVRWRLEAIVYVGARPTFRRRVDLSVQPVRLNTEQTSHERTDDSH